MALVFDGGFGDVDTPPNYVELDNNPPSSPWLTDYTATPPKGNAAAAPKITLGPLTIRPAARSATAAPSSSSSSSSAKTQRKRAGKLGELLDKVLPLMQDGAGKLTIYGLPPALVYVAGGILSATVVAYLLRLLKGGGRHVVASNPKRCAAATRRARRA